MTNQNLNPAKARLCRFFCILQWIGCILSFLMVLVGFFSTQGSAAADDYLLMLLFLIAGLLFWWAASFRGLVLKGYRRIFRFLSGRPGATLAELSEGTRLSEQRLRKVLPVLIGKGYFKAICYSQYGGTVRVETFRAPQETAVSAAPEPQKPLAPPSAPRKARPAQPSVTVSCPFCGGPNQLQPGQKGVCDYCGRWIKADDTPAESK